MINNTAQSANTSVAPVNPVVVSVVIPCLNEAKTIGTTVSWAVEFLRSTELTSEVVVADNGSTDGSQEIARQAGARVVNVTERGYGAALIAGCRAALGTYIIMGDADATYDFRECGPMVKKLQEGYDLVMGSRFKGRIVNGAMPWKNRYIGNPVLTTVLNLFFWSGLSDAHCGMRGFTKSAFEQMQLRSTGMEFASEMVVKAAVLNLRRTEVPVTLYPDPPGRTPHLRPWRDGWRHLRFLLLYSPLWLYIIPGVMLIVLSIILNVVLNLLPPDQFFRLGSLFFGTHWTIPATFGATLGVQLLFLGIAARLYAVNKGLLPIKQWVQQFLDIFSLERGIILGLTLSLIGIVIELFIFSTWAVGGFGELNAQRLGMLGLMWILIGLQVVFNSFFLSLLKD
jgi:glycosyltransferase involved in cell wall biosynthesis